MTTRTLLARCILVPVALAIGVSVASRIVIHHVRWAERTQVYPDVLPTALVEQMESHSDCWRKG